MSFEVRILDAEDGAVLANAAPGVFDHDVVPDLATEFLADPRHHIAVALDRGLVVGFASGVHYVHPDKPAELFVNEVGVAPTHQGQGIGTVVVQALLVAGRQAGCGEAWVLTDEENAAAMGLYRAAGGVRAARPAVMCSFDLRRLGSSGPAGRLSPP